MKQTSFLVEVVVKDNTPTIIFRAQNGAIIKISNDPSEMTSFLSEVVENLAKPVNPQIA